MADMNKLVEVTNRNSGFTTYVIPDTGVKRSFNLRETKRVPLEELIQLQSVPGGDYLLKNCLMVKDKEALFKLNMSDQEPEYFYTEDDIKVLLETGTLDQLEDTLNFAPEGVIEIIKKMAVDIKLPDTRKREMISKKTGLNIDSAININRMLEEENEAKEDNKKTRKAAPINADSAPKRKAAIPADKYKVVSTK